MSYIIDYNGWGYDFVSAGYDIIYLNDLLWFVNFDKLQNDGCINVFYFELYNCIEKYVPFKINCKPKYPSQYCNEPKN